MSAHPCTSTGNKFARCLVMRKAWLLPFTSLTERRVARAHTYTPTMAAAANASAALFQRTGAAVLQVAQWMRSWLSHTQDSIVGAPFHFCRSRSERVVGSSKYRLQCATCKTGVQHQQHIAEMHVVHTSVQGQNMPVFHSSRSSLTGTS